MDPQDKNSFHYNLLENCLITDFITLLKYEEDYWKLKSQLQWLNDRDANTHFFHLSTIKRRWGNRILGLQDTVRNWTIDPTNIHDLVVTHFQTLYTTQMQSRTQLQSTTYDTALTQEDGTTLTAPITTAKIYNAVHSFKPLKAPGPDGLHPLSSKSFGMPPKK